MDSMFVMKFYMCVGYTVLFCIVMYNDIKYFLINAKIMNIVNDFCLLNGPMILKNTPPSLTDECHQSIIIYLCAGC